MTTADWALSISLGSLLISLIAFVWNVWSKFIFPKPKITVSVAPMIMIQQHRDSFDFITLSATNHGPTPIILRQCMIKMKRRKLRKQGYGLLNPWHNFPNFPAVAAGPFGGGLPCRLEVGEEFSVHLPADHEALAKDNYTRIGFGDSFGRHHWASRKQMKETRASAKRKREDQEAE